MSRLKRVLLIMGGLLVLAGIPAGLIYRLRQQDQHERALIAAVTAGNERQVRAELRWGVSPNTRDMPDAPTDWREYVKRVFRRQPVPNRTQYTPALLLAERYKYYAIARLLLNAGADPNTTDSTGESPLMWALGRRMEDLNLADLDAETALLLLAKGADPNTHDSKGTALHIALQAQEWDVSRQLILRGADVNARDQYGDFPLLWADFDLSLIGLMLNKGANVNATNEAGTTVLMQASEKLTPLLLARGANVDVKNADGETALCIAVNHRELNKTRWLFRYGADCNPAHNDGWDLLYWSVVIGLPDLARLALAKGLQVNAQDEARRTPLMLAAAKGDTATVRWLLLNGANVNAQDKTDMTALMYAAQMNKTAIVQLLRQHGANSRLRDKEHRWTAMQYAQHFGCEDVVGLLQTGRLSPPLPADTNPNGEARRNRIHVDANRWLVRTPLAHKNDPYPDAVPGSQAYSLWLTDSAGRHGTPIVVHDDDRAPAMIAFRDVNGQRYVYVEAYDGAHNCGAIYLARKLKLLRKWAGTGRLGTDCVPLRGGGALIHLHEPERFLYPMSYPHAESGSLEVYRFRNGAMEKLGAIDTFGQ